ncbi:transketolase [Treponema socranskii]|uniref:transketolase n=1 Tax=Treponema socranskii TaxID=53419 RepID=UPI0023F4FE65|nr:transketolase [Treponema socranskii]
MNEKAIKAVAASVRSLSMDAIQKANSGHPGIPLGAAELAAVLYGDILKHNPADSKWADRDRFLISAGHGSMWLYAILHLAGYKVTLDDIKSFRQVGSKCPGHPEYGATDGVENTSGPLGQGMAMAVGSAIAETMLAARFNTASRKIVDHYTYSLVGEGCLQEGVASEASSLAGHLKLGKLIVFYDENKISIDGSTDIAFTDDIEKRYEAYGWQVLKGSMYEPENIIKLTEKAKQCTDKPTLIMLTSVIGKYAPKQGTPDVHGAPLGADGVKAAKEAIGLPSDKDFYVLPEAYDYFAAKKAVYAEREAEWKKEFEAWSEENPELRKEWDAFHTDSPTNDVPDVSFKVGDSLATRDASGKEIVVIAKRYGNVVGGSADLTGPNKTKIDDLDGVYSPENRKGRMIEFGIREFAMSAISAGISLHGGLRPFCATFLVFSDYLRPSLRVVSLMKQPVIYVFTHDSIYVGEDGPTHQPVETLASLRAIPGVQVLRPGDAEETVEAWKMAYESKDHPVCLALTRQKLTVYEKADKDWKKTIRTGAYVVQEGNAAPDITVLASGSEVNTALEAAKLVPEKKIRIVSVIDLKRFSEADDAVRNKIIGSAKRVVAAEAGIGTEWFRFVKDRSDIFCIETFGESGPAEKVAEHLHFTASDLAKLLKR